VLDAVGYDEVRGLEVVIDGHSASATRDDGRPAGRAELLVEVLALRAGHAATDTAGRGRLGPSPRHPPGGAG